MMASRFTKAFQLIALVLAFAVLQVYVMAGPIRTGNDPGSTATSSTAKPTADANAATPTSENKIATPEAGADKIALRFGSKSVLNRIFSKGDVEARIASGNSFLKSNTSATAAFKSSIMRNSAVQGGSTSDNDDDDGGRGTWIAVGVIAAVLAVAIIGLRHDRNNPGVQ